MAQRVRRTAAGVVLALATSVGAVITHATPAWATASSAPLPTVGANGDVLAIEADAEHVFIGGRFTYVGAHTNGGVVVNEATGIRIPTLARVKGGAVLASVTDGRGGWYIAGTFTEVAGSPRPGLARILSTGALATWAPSVNGTVSSLAFANGVVYAGGSFTSIGGASRSNLAAINESGAVTPWNPGANGQVRSLATDGVTLFAGGTFSTVGTQPRTNLAAIDVASGAVTPWNPGADGPVNSVATVNGVVNGLVYVGGAFTTVAGTPRSNLAAIGADAIATAWNPGTDGVVNAVVARRNGTAVFAGGSFTTAGGAPRANIAGFNTTDGAAMAWNPGVNGPVLDLALSRPLGTAPADARLFVVGTFTSAGGATRLNGAGLDSTTGAVVEWDPGADTTINDVTTSGSAVFVGGSYTWINGAPRQYIAALHRDTLELDRDWDPGADAPVRAIEVAPDGTAVYVGGEFTSFGGAARSRLAAVQPSTGAVTAWAPRANTTVTAIAASASTVYFGGGFTTVNGTNRSRIAAVNTGNGDLLGPWNPGASGTVRFLELSPDGSRLYAGGSYQTIAGTSRPGCAELDAATGAATTFAPSAGGDIVSMDLARDGSRLWCSTSSNRTYSYNPVGGGNTPLWTILSSGDVQATDDGPTDLYLGGHFSSIKESGQVRRLHAASADLTTGRTTAWNPGVAGNYGVWEVTVIGDLVFIGGDFDKVGNRTQPRFAVFAAA